MSSWGAGGTQNKQHRDTGEVLTNRSGAFLLEEYGVEYMHKALVTMD